MVDDSKRTPRWWSGGVCSALAVTLTHPLDLIKVQLQTQGPDKKPVIDMIKHIYKQGGFLGFYNGISASWFRQLTYTTARFALYEWGKQFLDASQVSSKVLLSIFAGVFGGAIGVPGDVVTVRMQNDLKLDPDKRRNYKHVFDGLYRIQKEEGTKSLFRGAIPAISRAILLTIGTNATYDQAKQILISVTGAKEGLPLHFATSTIAGCVGTIITQPIDVIKSTYMNAPPGQFSGMGEATAAIAKQGPLAFYKGFIPALLRIAPNTIIVFMLYEQARLRFGKLPNK
ncbi:hypothetical protein KR018_011566 [Drosophila ironensis]|nr:hypothetical protein KR018_011566 [Drosophila ironensis]